MQEDTPIVFSVSLILDPEGDGTIPTEEDMCDFLSGSDLFEVYPVISVTVKASS